MQARSILVVSMVATALASLVVGLVLWFDNPSVDVGASDIGDHGPAGRVECSIAPWDAVLNDNDDGPGGEHAAAFHDEVATECHAASSRRFTASVASGVLGLVLLAGATATGLRSTLRAP